MPIEVKGGNGIMISLIPEKMNIVTTVNDTLGGGMPLKTLVLDYIKSAITVYGSSVQGRRRADILEGIDMVNHAIEQIAEIEDLFDSFRTYLSKMADTDEPMSFEKFKKQLD